MVGVVSLLATATKWHSTYYEERLQTVNILIIRMFAWLSRYKVAANGSLFGNFFFIVSLLRAELKNVYTVIKPTK